MTDTAPRTAVLDDRSVARSAGVLMVAKPVAGVLFAAGLVVLPRWAGADAVSTLTWCAFAYLFITSVLNLGLERLVGPWVGRHPGEDLTQVVAPILTMRVATAPLAVGFVWVLFHLVGVHVAPLLFAWTVVWIGGGLVGSLVYAVIRVEGRTALEAVVSIALRALQALALVPVATGAWSVGTVVGVIAVVEVLAAVVLVRAAGLHLSRQVGPVRQLPWRLLGQFTLVELVAFLYLRVDVLLVGHVLGQADGATYTLLYRPIDAIVALITPLLLVVYPHAAVRAERGGSLVRFRQVGLLVVPVAFGLLASLGTLGVGPAVGLVPRYASHALVVRLLLAAVPLIAWSSVELHLRAAEGKVTEVVWIGAVTLVVAAGVTVPALHLWGLSGAAAGVLVAEAVQLGLLASLGSRDGAGWAVGSSLALLAVCLLSAHTALWWLPALAVTAALLLRLHQLRTSERVR